MSRVKQEKRILNNHKPSGIEKTAQIIRIITAPPFMIAALLLVLGLIPIGFYTGITDQCVAWIGLVLLPLLAYPLHYIIPELRKTGREGQRKTAFIFSLWTINILDILRLLTSFRGFFHKQKNFVPKFFLCFPSRQAKIRIHRRG